MATAHKGIYNVAPDKIIDRLLSGVVLRGAVLIALLLVGLVPVVVGEPGARELPAGGQPPVAEIKSDDGRLELNPYISLLEDKSTKLDFAQVREYGDFHPVGDSSPNFGFTSSAWWVKFTVRNPRRTTEHVVIRQDYPLIDYFDVWYSQGDAEGDSAAGGTQWKHIATGDRRVFDQRPLDNRTFLIPITLAPGETTQVYARFQTQGSMNIGLYLHSNQDLIKWVGAEYLALGGYYGGFLVLIVYNLIMFISVREKAFVYYMLYVLNYGLYMSVHNGISFQYLWPDNTWTANQSLPILLALSLYWVLRFTRTILSTSVLAPRSDRIAWAMEWLSIAFVGVSLFLPYRTIIVPISLLTMVISAQLMTMAMQTALKGSMPARYYLIAFTTLLLSAFVYMLKTFGWLPHNPWTQNAFQVGSLIEMVLLSIAVASRVNEIKQQTFVDTLTQLYNRRYMSDQLGQEMLRAQRRGQPLALAILDIDHFKQFNDSRGHAAGDMALQTVANILNDTVRKPATPCRYGGEEFVLILPNTDAQGAKALAERVRRRIEEATADTLGLTVSIGYASTERDEFADEDELFKAADFALYQAKGGGRNRVMHFVREDDRRHSPQC